MAPGEPRFDPSLQYPHIFDVSWDCFLPQSKGLTKGCRDWTESVEAAHKCHNADQLDDAVGLALCQRIDARDAYLRDQAMGEAERHKLSGFLAPRDGEEEIAFQQRLLREVKQRLGPVVVACLMGSRRYNLHFPDSDRDLLVVYAAPAEREAVTIKNPAGVEPDYTIMDAATFADMLSRGIPFCVESLYLEQGMPAGGSRPEALLESHPILWPMLLHHREAFLQ